MGLEEAGGGESLKHPSMVNWQYQGLQERGGNNRLRSSVMAKGWPDYGDYGALYHGLVGKTIMGGRSVGM